MARLDALEGYLEELKSIVALDFEEYQRNFEKRRACERLLQISIETAIDICSLFVKGMRLGLPGEEDDLFDKLHRAGVISERMRNKLQKMGGYGTSWYTNTPGSMIAWFTSGGGWGHSNP